MNCLTATYSQKEHNILDNKLIYRKLTPTECARLQTFPDSYFFEGTMKRAYWQIGNAVPVILAKHIGLAIKPLIETLYEKDKINLDELLIPLMDEPVIQETLF